MPSGLALGFLSGARLVERHQLRQDFGVVERACRPVDVPAIGLGDRRIVTARLLPRVLGLDTIDDILVADEAFEELVPFGG